LEKNSAEQVLPGSWGAGEMGVRGDVVQTMYTPVSKCKTDKRRKKKKGVIMIQVYSVHVWKCHDRTPYNV
jgi:hypothetical protein